MDLYPRSRNPSSLIWEVKVRKVREMVFFYNEYEKESTEKCELTVKLIGSLRSIVNNDTIKVCIPRSPITVTEFLRLLVRRYGDLTMILDERGRLKPSFLLFINNVDYALLGRENATLKCGDVIAIVPVVHGG